MKRLSTLLSILLMAVGFLMMLGVGIMHFVKYPDMTQVRFFREFWPWIMGPFGILAAGYLLFPYDRR